MYNEGKFSIETTQPSQIVMKGFEKLPLPADFRALDLGCGNGRNSVYAAALGGRVDAVDVEAIDFKQNLAPEIQDKITFHKGSVMDFEIQPETYTAIIATRLLQYLSPEEMHILLGRIGRGLTGDGIAMFSYTASGGVLDRPDMDVPKYQHSIETVKQELEATGLEILGLDQGASVTTHVPYQVPLESYDILTRRRG